MVARPAGSIAAVPSLPVSTAEFERRVKIERTLNDYVEDIHHVLYDAEDGSYKGFLEAVYDEDAKEGSLAADNLEAAALIREYAIEHNIAMVKTKKKQTIVKALNVVLRRYVGQSRRDRRDMVGGTIVRSSGESSGE